MILRKFAESFHPVNTGELRHKVFEGQTFTFRSGAHLYMAAIRQSRSRYSVFKLNRRPMSLR